MRHRRRSIAAIRVTLASTLLVSSVAAQAPTAPPTRPVAFTTTEGTWVSLDVTRDGRQYTVFYTEKRVEVIRLGYAGRGDHEAIRATMIGLIPQVTGCILNDRSLQGDSGEMRGSIRCPKV